MRKIVSFLCIMLYPCMIVGQVKRVDFGVRFGLASQSFEEETWGSELWKSLGGLIEYRIPASSFSIRGDMGAGLYERTEAVKTTKLDLQLEVGPKYLWEIASAEVGVYGGEAVSRIGISNGLCLGFHYYTVEKKYADSLVKDHEIGFGLHLWCGFEYLISRYILFAEIGFGRILRGDIFQEKYGWSQITFNGGVRL